MAASSLIVEDGSVVPTANTYAVVADLRAFAKVRGETLPSADADCEVLLLKAMDFLAGLNYQGNRFRPDIQILDWPRANVMIENWPHPYQEIPRQLIFAQCAIAIEAQSFDILPTQDVGDAAGAKISETVGPITTVYTNSGTVRRTPAMAKAEVHLRLLLRRQGLVAIRA